MSDTYVYDAAGNRTSDNRASALQTATVNSVNQMTNVTQVNATTVSGSVNKPATLTVNGNAVTLGGGNSFSTSLLLPLGPNTVTFVATDSAGNQIRGIR